MSSKVVTICLERAPFSSSHSHRFQFSREEVWVGETTDLRRVCGGWIIVVHNNWWFICHLQILMKQVSIVPESRSISHRLQLNTFAVVYLLRCSVGAGGGSGCFGVIGDLNANGIEGYNESLQNKYRRVGWIILQTGTIRMKSHWISKLHVINLYRI